MKTVSLKGAAGVRNDVSPERYEPADLVAGRNVDLDETGKMYRRKGRSQVSATAAHSMWGCKQGMYVVQGGSLKQMSVGGGFTTLASVAGDRVAYLEQPGKVYWSDGVATGCIRDGRNHPWGIAVAGVAFSVTPTTGALRAGAYSVGVTYVRASGLESGVPQLRTITLPAGGGITLASLPVSTDPEVTEKRVYVTTCNGELPYLALTLSNAATSATISALPQGVPLRTLHKGPPPPGSVLGSYRGRVFIANGRFLWYSQPYETELLDYRSGFIVLESGCRTFASVSDGIFVGSETETLFFTGDDPAQFVQLQKAAYGTVLGTELVVPNYLLGEAGVEGESAVWMSLTGVCAGFNGGAMKNLTGSRHIPEQATEGASLLKLRDGTPQFVVSLFR